MKARDRRGCDLAGQGTPPPTQYAFPRFASTAGFCRTIAYWDEWPEPFFPPVLPRRLGRPGPACFVRGLRNSSVTGTPNAPAILARDLTVRFSPPPSMRCKYFSVKPRRSAYCSWVSPARNHGHRGQPTP